MMNRLASPLLIALIAVGGCAPASQWDGRPAASAPKVSTRTTEFTVTSATAGLKPWDADRIRSAIASAKPDGLRVEIVSAADVDPAALSRSIRDLGVSSTRIRIRRSGDLPAASAVVLVNDTRLEIPRCDGAGTSSEPTGMALAVPSPEIGCATRANFATMLADPNDLIGSPAARAYNTAPAVKALDDMRDAGDTHKSAQDGNASSSSGKGSSPSGSQSK